MMIVAVALMALPVLAQNYGNPYKPATQNGMHQVGTPVPAASFQSTSAMSGSGSTYSANPTLNNDGTAAYNGASSPAKAPGGPHRAPDTVNPDDDDAPEGHETRPDDPNPLGDAVLPLLLMALAFCGYVYFRKRKAQA